MDTENQVYSIAQFCDAHDISRSFFHLLRTRGQAPDLMCVGRRLLITKEAAAEWRQRMEATTVQRENHERAPAQMAA